MAEKQRRVQSGRGNGFFDGKGQPLHEQLGGRNGLDNGQTFHRIPQVGDSVQSPPDRIIPRPDWHTIEKNRGPEFVVRRGGLMLKVESDKLPLDEEEQWEQYTKKTLPENPRTYPEEFVDRFRTLVGFDLHEESGRIQIDPSAVIFERKKYDANGQVYVETYKDKYDGQSEKSAEAACFAIVEFGGQEVMVVVNNRDFFTGTVGEATGKEMVRGIEIATKQKMPLMIVHSSAGVRLQEGIPALQEMEELAVAIDRHQRIAKKPYISVICDSHGGQTASATEGTLIWGVKGTRFAFTGDETARRTGNPMTRADQSVERHYTKGNVDLIIESPQDLVDKAHKFFRLAGNLNRNSDETLQRETELPDKAFVPDVPPPGFYTADQIPRFDRIVDVSEGLAKKTFSQSEKAFLRKFDPRRVDFQRFFYYAFGEENVFPLAMNWRLAENDRLHGPQIGAFLIKAGDQTLLAVTNMHDLDQTQDRLRKRPSTPDVPSITRLNRRLLRLGEQLGVDLLKCVDTSGSVADKNSEWAGLAAAMQEAQVRTANYKWRVIEIDDGDFMSGGGMILGATSDKRLATEGTEFGVADAGATAHMLHRDPPPTPEQVEHIYKTRRGTAQEQHELGTIDGIIYEPDGGAVAHPFLMINNMKRALIEATIELNEKSIDSIRRRRTRRRKKPTYPLVIREQSN